MPREPRFHTLPALLAVLFVLHAIPPSRCANPCAKSPHHPPQGRPGPARRTPPPTLHTATRIELDIIKVLLAQEAAWNRGDIDAFAQAYKNSPDTLFITHQVNRRLRRPRRRVQARLPPINFSPWAPSPSLTSKSTASTKNSPSASANTSSTAAKKTAATSKESSPSSSRRLRQGLEDHRRPHYRIDNDPPPSPAPITT